MEGLRALREAIRRYAWVVLDMGLINGSGRCPAGRDNTSFTVHSMLIQTTPAHQDMHLHKVQTPYTWAIWSVCLFRRRSAAFLPCMSLRHDHNRSMNLHIHALSRLLLSQQASASRILIPSKASHSFEEHSFALASLKQSPDCRPVATGLQLLPV